MPQSPQEIVAGLYEAFGRGDVPALLAGLDEEIDWSTPEALPHGGDFHGRDGVARFFEGIGEQWESLEVELEALVGDQNRVVALVRAHGQLRGTRAEYAYSAAHAWTLRDRGPVRFDEYINAPMSLPSAHAAAR